MRILHTIIFIFIGSFIIQYFLMSSIMSNNFSNITNSLGKVYLSIIMALYMIVLEIMMRDYQYNVFSINRYGILIVLLGIFIYLYRNQVGINDKEYLKEMIEHHSMALLTSNEILKKTDNYNISKLAKNIVLKQEEEIQFMNKILKDIKNKK